MSDASKNTNRTLKQLTIRVWREMCRDDVFGAAAQLAYYFLLALFPLLIFLTSIIGYLPGVQNSFLTGLGRTLPPDAMKLVRETLDDVVSHRSSGLLSFGLIGALWAASSGVSSLINSLNTAYDAKETRSFWMQRLVALVLTLTLGVLIAGGSTLIMLAHRLGNWLERTLELGPTLSFLSTVLGYLLGVALLLVGIVLLYYFGLAHKARKAPVLPGALFATLGILVGSLLFSFYLRVVPSASATYGSLGAVVTLMLWLYLMGLMLLIGGEINSEIKMGVE
jgi:membrane protein